MSASIALDAPVVLEEAGTEQSNGFRAVDRRVSPAVGELGLAATSIECLPFDLSVLEAAGVFIAEAFAFVGLTQYVDAFINFARTEPDAAFSSGVASELQAADSDTRLTHLLIVDDQDRTRAFYEHVLGATVVRERNPVILQFHNSWIVANVGGAPTDDKPEVTLVPPLQPNLASYALNVRVADVHAVY